MKRRAHLPEVTRREAIAGLTASVTGVLATQSRAQSQASAGTSCVLTPQTSEGPFYFDPKLVRSDITENQPGVPITLRMQIVTAGNCAPIQEARVDVWHAGASGLYSGYSGQSGNGSNAGRSATGKTWLRGTQFADEQGRVVFRTVYPSWYRGRTPHIHFKVILGPREVAVSQLYFEDRVSERVFGTSRDYVPRQRGRDTFNENDMYLRGGRVGGAFCDVVEEDGGLIASVTIGIERA